MQISRKALRLCFKTKSTKKLVDPRDKELVEKIEEAEKLLTKVKRHLLPYAETIAFEVIEWLKELDCIEKIDTLGSQRRKAATVGDIDIAVANKCGMHSVLALSGIAKRKDVKNAPEGCKPQWIIKSAAHMREVLEKLKWA